MSIGNRSPSARADGRGPNDLRPVTMTLNVLKWAEGSCRIRVGDTEVLCAATIADRVPPHLRGKGSGWVTAEYSMLPRATAERSDREAVKGRLGGRTHEIQRLIGRSLRGVVDFEALGERTIYVDCDVLQADGGTRCASITGGYVALDLACRKLLEKSRLTKSPLTQSVAAISCGIVDGVPLLDLDYPEDSTAEVDANVVMTGDGGLVEVQATAERMPLSRANLDELLRLAAHGIEGLRALQVAAVG
jgi:ribonuclease PH